MLLGVNLMSGSPNLSCDTVGLGIGSGNKRTYCLGSHAEAFKIDC